MQGCRSLVVDFRQSRVARPYPEDLATQLTRLDFVVFLKVVLLLVSIFSKGVWVRN